VDGNKYVFDLLWIGVPFADAANADPLTGINNSRIKIKVREVRFRGESVMARTRPSHPIATYRAVIRHTLGLVPSVEDMTNWGGDYLNGQAVVGASCVDNGAIDDLERLFFRVRSQATGQRG
jgi:hypothetical protein